MIINILRKYKKVVIVVLLLGFIFTAYEIYIASTFHIIKTDPSVSNISVISPYFDVHFSKNLSKDIKVQIIPSNASSSTVISGKNIKINLISPLLSSQSYKITITNIYSLNGDHLGDKVFNFKPVSILNTKLSKEQTKVITNQQSAYKDASYANGLSVILPFIGPDLNYRINYTSIIDSNNKPVITIIISYKSEQSKTDAVAWLKTQGFNINDYKVQYLGLDSTQQGQ